MPSLRGTKNCFAAPAQGGCFSFPLREKIKYRSEKKKKRLDRSGSIAYIIGALRRQQVAKAVNPAEDINKILIVFVPLRLLMQRISL